MSKEIIFKALKLRHKEKHGVVPEISYISGGVAAISANFRYHDNNDKELTTHSVSIEELLQFMYTQGYLDRGHNVDPQFPEYKDNVN